MVRSILASAAVLLPLFQQFTFAIPQTASASSSTACNNSPSLCSRTYTNVTYLGAHDSPFVSNTSNGFDVSGNQFYDTTTQLSAGVRLIQAQMQYPNSSSTSGPIHLCHTSCSLYDAGTLQDWLYGIKTWMDSNPNEVVTLLLVNGIDADAATLDSIFTASGITQYAYKHSASTGWPTLQSMISANTRLVTFIASLSDNSEAPYLLNEFDYIWENNYLVTAASNFTCTPDRPSAVAGSLSSAKSSGRMFLMNHFLDVQQGFLNIQTPNMDAANTTNSADASITGSLGQSASQCSSQWGAAPNYVLVDWFNVGPAIDTVDALNGVTSPTGRTSVSSANAKTASTSAAGGRAAGGSSVAALVLALGAAVAVGWM